ncbi:MAG TPA: alanine racemase [Nocardioidaceae bacterium]|nr:alanine racemase [Nocardioidaceae bacterium]
MTPRPGRGNAHTVGPGAASWLNRHRLAHRLSDAVGTLSRPPAPPAYLVDLDAFEANADDLVRRAGGTPIRVATKSLRVPDLIRRALARPGFRGVLAYTLREALWLHRHGVSDDIVLGYPTTDREALRQLTRDERAASAITVMVDDPAQLDLLEQARAGSSGPPVRIALDVDAALQVGPVHLGPRRSPVRDTAAAVALAREVTARDGFVLDGVMTYEGQVAGVPDAVPGHRARSAAVRGIKAASVRQLARRRRAIAEALAQEGLARLRFWNAGGTGSLELSAADPAVTEVTAGSGLLVPTLFDHYRAFSARPAAFLGFPVVRRPGPGRVTVAGGGLIASGPPGADRVPTPWAPPGLRLAPLEGAGEVQTPLSGTDADLLALGDWVWFRHAKAGEPAEHVRSVHLVRGRSVEATEPTYRGVDDPW